jgi:hypothetical protein
MGVLCIKGLPHSSIQILFEMFLIHKIFKNVPEKPEETSVYLHTEGQLKKQDDDERM